MLGGGERHLRSLGAALVASGSEAVVVTRRTDAAWPAEEVLDGIAVRRVGPAGRGRAGKFAMVPAALREVRRLRHSFDVLVVRGTRVLGAPAVALARWMRKPVILQPEVNGEFSGEVFTWGKPWARGVAGRLVREAAALRLPWLTDADAVVAMSHLIAHEAGRAGFARERIHLIPHGIDLARFHPVPRAERAAIRRRLGLDERMWIVSTGRLLRGKGLESLVDAFASLRERFPRASLHIVGSGDGQPLSIETQLRLRAASLGDAVRFTGRVENIEEYLQAADVFAFPSEYEALGLSLIEAAACGLPCIGSRTGGIVDVIDDGVTGLLVPPRDTQALAEALARLLADDRETEALRAAFGAAAAERARAGFDERHALVRYRSLFAETSA